MPHAVYYVIAFFMGFVSGAGVVVLNLWGRSVASGESPPVESVEGKVEFIDAVSLEEKFKTAKTVDDILKHE